MLVLAIEQYGMHFSLNSIATKDGDTPANNTSDDPKDGVADQVRKLMSPWKFDFLKKLFND